jgi:thiol-disulfide isomerase/thioredoxin
MEPTEPEGGAHADRGRGLRALLVVVAVAAVAVVLGVLSRRSDRAGNSPQGSVSAPAGASARAPVAAERVPLQATGLVRQGEIAPDLELPALTGGGTLKLADLRGNLVVLNAWASWCAPCVEEMPSLERLHREVAGDRIRVVTVAVDDPPGPARALATRLGLTMPVALDRGGARLAMWSTVKYPETWILGPDGTVLSRVVGARDWAHPDGIAELRRMAGR